MLFNLLKQETASRMAGGLHLVLGTYFKPRVSIVFCSAVKVLDDRLVI